MIFLALEMLGYNRSISSLLILILPNNGLPRLIWFLILEITFLIFLGFPDPRFKISPFKFFF